MGEDDSIRKLKRKISAKKKRENELEIASSQLAQKEGNLANKEDRHCKNKMKKKKNKSSVDIARKVDTEILELATQDETHKTSGENKKIKKMRNNKEDKLQKMRRKKRKIAENINKVDEIITKDDDQQKECKPEDYIAKSEALCKPEDCIAKSEALLKKGDRRRKSETGKSKKLRKTKTKSVSVENDVSLDNLLENRGQDAQDEVFEMSSGDEDYSKGMKKWISQYHQSRPGLELLQKKIDRLLMAHEAQVEKAKLEREAQVGEGGWTVVVHHKGRKKTTEAETGVAVGSISQAAILDKMAKKKTKEVGVDFYRFQKREANRNEIVMLQSKFEEDKKRIQQLRAARKFRPY